MLSLLVALLAGQISSTAEVEHLTLDAAARGTLLVGNGKTLKGGTYRVGAAFQYSNGHVKAGGATLLRDRLALHLTGAVGVTRWLEFSGEFPVVLSQKADSAGFAVNSAGMATPYIHAKVGILDETDKVALWVSLGLGVPVGTGGALGNHGPVFQPRVNLGRNFEVVALGVEAGALIHPIGSFADARGLLKTPRHEHVGSQLYLSAGASTIGEGLRGEVSARLFATVVGTEPGLEVLFGARYPFKALELFFLGGPGLFGAPTTPSFRVYLGVAFGNQGAPLPHCTEQIDYRLTECPALDRDADGVPNGVDAAPLLPEDKDGFQDEDGAPDPDNDQDGVLDGDDACPNQKGSVLNRGCPDLDRDGDGVVDRLDGAPDVPEDDDGYKDDDGVPEPDNDDDGFLDAADACPNEVGIAEEHGCAPRDDDKDGTVNHLDNCRVNAGPADNRGCPPDQKQLVAIGNRRLTLAEPVQFEKKGDALAKKSFPMLDQLAAVLIDKPYIGKVVIVETTVERANAIRDFLVKRAVATERLLPMGGTTATTELEIRELR